MKKSLEDLKPEEIRISRVRRKQKNGDTYVYEQVSYYDREAKYNRTLKSTLVAKILAGGTEEVRTRAKKRSDPAGRLKKAAAELRLRVSMMDILHHVGTVTGIDEDLRTVLDGADAGRVLSMARYMVAADSAALEGVEEFQYTHVMPQAEVLTRQVCREVMTRIGKSREIPEAFFRLREKRCGLASPGTAYEVRVLSEGAGAGLLWGAPAGLPVRVFCSPEGEPLSYRVGRAAVPQECCLVTSDPEGAGEGRVLCPGNAGADPAAEAALEALGEESTLLPGEEHLHGVCVPGEKGARMLYREEGREEVFCLLDTAQSDPSVSLARWRRRLALEKALRITGGRDGEALASAQSDLERGRLFVAFAALCYEDFLNRRIREMEKTLGRPTGDPLHDGSGMIERELSLLQWLRERSTGRILRWFDVGEETIVNGRMKARRLASDILERDLLFLEKLGIAWDVPRGAGKAGPSQGREV